MREGVKVASCRPANRFDEGRLVERRQVGNPLQSVSPKFGRGHRADTPQNFDRQRVEKRRFATWFHHDQSIGLRHRTGNLGQVFGSCHADAEGQTDLGGNPCAEGAGNAWAVADQASKARHVDECFVDGDALDFGRGFAKDLKYCLARLTVGVHTSGYYDSIRTHPLRLTNAGWAPHAGAFCFVTRSCHDPHTDKDGFSAQGRIVSLFYRRIERVEIGVENGRTRLVGVATGHQSHTTERVFVCLQLFGHHAIHRRSGYRFDHSWCDGLRASSPNR